MSKFAEVIASNLPRLVVQFQRGEDGQERFSWGVVGSIPIMSVIGAIAAVQYALVAVDDGLYNKCDDLALVIACHVEMVEGNPVPRVYFSWYVHPDIPLEPLIGILEMIKQTFVGQQFVQAAQVVQQRPQLYTGASRFPEGRIHLK